MKKRTLNFCVTELEGQKIKIRFGFHAREGSIDLKKKLENSFKNGLNEILLVKILKEEFPNCKLVISALEAMFKNGNFNIIGTTKLSWLIIENEWFEIEMEKRIKELVGL